MKDTAVTIKYMNALCNTLEEKDLIPGLEELQSVINDICGHDKVWALLQSPLTSAGEKRALVAPRLSNCKHIYVKNLFQLLITKSRVNQLTAFLPLIESRLSEAKAIKKAKIETAGPVSDTAKAAIITQLKSQFNTDIDATYSEDDSLIGGFIATVGTKQLDGSIKYTLKQFETTLIK